MQRQHCLFHAKAMMRIATRKVPLLILALSAVLLFVSGQASVRADDDKRASNMVYVGSNDPRPGHNSILAYRRAANGTLTLLAEYFTGGRGVANPNQIIGPNDADRDLIASPDRKTLFAVNAGSDTIAVFHINPDGSLNAVHGSPFPSGGINPVSLALRDNRLYVVNKNQDPDRPNNQAPNYTVLKVGGDGTLTPLPNSTIDLPVGASPTEALLSPDSDQLFGMQLYPGALNGMGSPVIGAVDSFHFGPQGRLIPAATSPQSVPTYTPPANAIAPFNEALNGAVHPYLPLLYVNFVTYTQIGVYLYDQQGNLFFVGAAANTGVAPCWDVVTHDGKYMYTSNAFSNSVSTYSLLNPIAPVETQNLGLGDPMHHGAFRISLTPDEKYLYVIDQKLDTNFMDGSQNQIWVLKIGANGQLSVVPNSTIQLPIPATARAQGILAL